MTDHQQAPEDEQNNTPLEERLQLLEAALQTSQQHAMRFFHEAPAPYFQLNVQGRIIEVNDAGCALLGQSREELLRRSLRSFMAPNFESSFALLLKQTLEENLQHEGEVQVVRADESPCDLLLRLSTYPVDGVGVTCLVIAMDITSHKQAHQQLLNENAHQREHLQAQTSRVRVLRQELETIVTVFIQQLHLPVARAMNYLSLHRQTLQNLPEDDDGPLLNTERALQQIFALLGSMDRFMQTRRMRVKVRSVDLNNVFDEVLKDAQPLMVDRTIHVTHDLLPIIPGDSRAAYLILDEYISNALKFTRERNEARIRVIAKETASEYWIGVEDNGSGFKMHQKAKLFQLFGRLHPSSVYEGTGIGLVTVRHTCERFGGRVWAEGKVDQGATFWFAWPKEPTLLNG